MTSPDLIVIVGMGRSGSSLLCQLLSSLGVYFGDFTTDTIGPTPINLYGQYENLAISRVLDRVLDNNGITHWLTDKTVTTNANTDIPDGIAVNMIATELKRLSQRVDPDNRSRHTLGLKDARATLCWHFVEAAALMSGLIPKWVYSRRRPGAIRASIERVVGHPIPRDGFTKVYDNYTRAVENKRELGAEIFDVRYEYWFSRSSAMRQLDYLATALDLEVTPDDLSVAYELIDPSVRHA